MLLVIVVSLGFVGLFLGLKRLLERQHDAQLESVVDRVFGASVTKIAEQSKEILSAEKAVIQEDLKHKHAELRQLVDKLTKEMEVRQKEIRSLEQDRIKSFSSLSTQLKEQHQTTQSLKATTEQLSKVLSNNQQRGAWGERIIEDLLEANGLQQGIHFERQYQLTAKGLRPDIALLLPDKRVVAVDVKFPFAQIQAMAEASTQTEKKRLIKLFSSDVKQKIDKVAEYISPEDNTLDYAILFVPNEMIFSFINSQVSDLVDYSMSKRVLLVSPGTFVMVALTVKESYRNFMIADTLREIVVHVDEFVGEWDRFKKQFEKYGRSIATLQSDYQNLTGTRVRQMERRIEKIESYRQGSVLPDGRD